MTDAEKTGYLATLRRLESDPKALVDLDVFSALRQACRASDRAREASAVPTKPPTANGRTYREQQARRAGLAAPERAGLSGGVTP